MSFAAESELGSLYINTQTGVEERIILEEMGHGTPAAASHPRPNRQFNSRRNNKLTCSATNSSSDFLTPAGLINYADYWTKHHPAAHYRNMRN
jgi:hypothetical protein